MKVDFFVDIIQEVFDIQVDSSASFIALNGVTIDGRVDKALPYLNRINSSKISNSTVSNLSELLKFGSRFNALTIDKVTFLKDYYDPSVLNGFDLKLTPRKVYIENCSFNAEALQDFTQLEFLFIRNCHIVNPSALSHLPSLYQLELDTVSWEQTARHISTPSKKRKHRLLRINNSCLNNLHPLKPFAEEKLSLYFSNCRIEDISDLGQFPKLSKCSFDASSTLSSNTCSIVNPDSELELVGFSDPLHLECFASVAPKFKQLSFSHCTLKELSGLSAFHHVEKILLSDSQLDLSAFLPLSQNISYFECRSAQLLSTTLWNSFTQVHSINVFTYSNEGFRLNSLKQLLPLSKQLKRLLLWEEDLDDLSLIDQFTELEVLGIYYAPFDTAKRILGLSSLKKLHLNTLFEEVQEIDLSSLIRLEYLQIDGEEDIHLRGLEALNNLNSLNLDIGLYDLNTLPALPQLKRLEISGHAYVDDEYINNFEQFENLEELKVKSMDIKRIGSLKKLRILDLSGNTSIETFEHLFEDLPSLERLSLADTYGSTPFDNKGLFALSKLQNLQYLSLMETDISNINGLELLENLAYLDLGNTAVRDSQTINKIKKLKEVNTWSEQLRAEIKPEIKVRSLPFSHQHFRVWEKRKLEDEFE